MSAQRSSVVAFEITEYCNTRCYDFYLPYKQIYNRSSSRYRKWRQNYNPMSLKYRYSTSPIHHARSSMLNYFFRLSFYARPQSLLVSRSNHGHTSYMFKVCSYTVCCFSLDIKQNLNFSRKYQTRNF